MENITKAFNCVGCGEVFNTPVELACRHIGCKRCFAKKQECPACFQKIIRIVCNTRSRNDLTNLHKCWQELLGIFEMERSSNAPKNISHKSSADKFIFPPTADDTSADTANMSPSQSAMITNTSVTYFDGDSEMFGNPHTPLEPYPFETQPLPTPKKKTPTITQIQKLPIIDTQFFTAWDTQDKDHGETSLSPEKLIDDPEVEDKLTQSQPLDLTFELETENIETSVHPQRRLGFAPVYALDLRLKTDKTPGPEHNMCHTVVKESEADIDLNATKVATPATVIALSEFSKKLLPVPVPLQPTSINLPIPIYPSTPVMRKTQLTLRTTPRRLNHTELRQNETAMRTPEVSRGPAPDTQFGDGDDLLLLEVEDCMTLVNGNKRRQDGGDNENDADTSDEELFPLSIPETKRQKVTEIPSISRNDLSKTSGTSKKTSQFSQARTTVENKKPVSEIISTSKQRTPEPESIVEDDLFGPSWTPPEHLLELEKIHTAPKFIFCPTRLYSDQLNKLEELCTLCNGEIRKDFSEDVTHLLLNIEKEGISYTFKYLLAIARKKWVLTFSWVEECVKQGKIVSEEKFETSNVIGSDPGPRVSRLKKTNLFDGFNFHVPFDLKSSGVSAADCKQLLTALGGVILEVLPKTNERLLILGDLANFTINYQKLYENRGWLTIAWDWILDCVLSYKLIPFQTENILTPGIDGIVLSQVSVPKPLLTL